MEFEAERAHLQGLAPAWRGAISGARPARPPDQAKQINQTDTPPQPVEFKAASEIEPIDVQQHPLAVFDALLRQIQTQARMQPQPQPQPLWVGA